MQIIIGIIFSKIQSDITRQYEKNCIFNVDDMRVLQIKIVLVRKVGRSELLLCLYGRITSKIKEPERLKSIRTSFLLISSFLFYGELSCVS